MKKLAAKNLQFVIVSFRDTTFSLIHFFRSFFSSFTTNSYLVRSSSSAFSLLEIILAVAIFGIFGATLLTTTIGVSSSTENSNDRLAARYLVQEAQEALRSMRDYDWDEIDLDTSGTYGLDTASGFWELEAEGTSDVVGKFTRTVSLTKNSSVSYDAEITVIWNTVDGIAQTKTGTIRLTNWKALFFSVDSLADFDEGFFNSILSVVPGSAQFDSVVEEISGWSSPTSTFENMSQDIYEIFIDDNLLYVATRSTVAAAEFFVYDIKDVTDGGLPTDPLDSFEVGAHVYDFVIDQGYAYLATSGWDELVVVDVSDSLNLVAAPASPIGLTGGRDAYAVDVKDDKLVIVRDSHGSTDEVWVYDIDVPGVTLTFDASYNSTRDVNDVEIYDGYAYMATDVDIAELVILDVDTGAFTFFPISGNANAESVFIDEVNEILYLGREQSGGEDEFSAYDISSPTSPTLDGSSNITKNVNDIYVFDGLAYLATDFDGTEAHVVDLSDFSFEVITSVLGTGRGEAIYYQGSHIYLGGTDNSYELQALTSAAGSVSGWTLATIIDGVSLNFSQDIFAMEIDGDYAYLGRDRHRRACTSSNGRGCEFIIINIADPEAPFIESAIDLDGDVNDIYINGDFAYVATESNSNELEVIDISDKSSPSVFPLGGFNTNSNDDGEAVWGNGSELYLGTQENGGACDLVTGDDCEFYILDIDADEDTPPVIAGVEIDEDVWTIAASSTHAFAGVNVNGAEIQVIETATPTLLTPLGHTGNADPNEFYYDAANDNLHTVFDDNDVDEDYTIYSASGATLTYLGGLSTDAINYSVAVDNTNDVAFLAGDENGEELKIIDISDLNSPSEIASVDLLDGANAVATDDTYVFIGSTYNPQEFQVVKEGDAPVPPSSEFVQNGIYTTKVFDSTGTVTTWGVLEWATSAGIVKLQSRTAYTLEGLDSAAWVGASGVDSFYTTSGGTLVLEGGAGKQYLQIAVYFEGDGSATPVLTDLTIGYTP
ncbi:hypothetical protein HOD30_01525 [Candidatus Peregrinibacteria bacterium]|jgi:type II secretory pathway pseudopilin PulG|nr:hypothetical protein [Candidatus Peregrinibacteria bacterium]MBT4632216.1 hypothetical protein [Candidatus Peregrinibacteria bacterium]